MSKVILVMDMPDNCITCKLSDWDTCRITRKCNTKGRKVECPLRELPEKQVTHPIDNMFQRGAKNGWNACINEILKGEEHETH